MPLSELLSPEIRASDVAGALSLGGAAAYSPKLFEAISRHRQVKRDLAAALADKTESLAKLKPQVGDVLVGSSRRDLAAKNSLMEKIQSTVLGGRDHHAYVLLPDSSGELKAVAVGADGRSKLPPQKRLAALYSTIERQVKQGRIPKTKEFVEQYRSKVDTLNEAARRHAKQKGTTTVPTMKEFVSKWSDPLSTMGGERSGSFRLLRPNQPLGADDVEQLWKNTAKVNDQTISKADRISTGVRNTLFGRGNYRDVAPTSCSGGVCTAYSHMANLGNPQKTLPTDLARNKFFTQVGEVGSPKKRVDIARKGLRFTRGLSAGRAAPVVGGVALGSYLLGDRLGLTTPATEGSSLKTSKEHNGSQTESAAQWFVRKLADAEDPLLERMQQSGLDKGEAIAIAKSRGWVKQSGKHLELTSKGRKPAKKAKKTLSSKEAAEQAYAEFLGGSRTKTASKTRMLSFLGRFGRKGKSGIKAPPKVNPEGSATMQRAARDVQNVKAPTANPGKTPVGRQPADVFNVGEVSQTRNINTVPKSTSGKVVAGTVGSIGGAGIVGAGKAIYDSNSDKLDPSNTQYNKLPKGYANPAFMTPMQARWNYSSINPYSFMYNTIRTRTDPGYARYREALSDARQRDPNEMYRNMNRRISHSPQSELAFVNNMRLNRLMDRRRILNALGTAEDRARQLQREPTLSDTAPATPKFNLANLLKGTAAVGTLGMYRPELDTTGGYQSRVDETNKKIQTLRQVLANRLGRDRL